MAQALRWSDLTTIVTPSGTLTFNATTGDTYFVDPARSDGLGMGEIRNPTDDRGQIDGFILHRYFEKGALLLVAGTVLARSDTTGTTGADALMGAMVTALRSTLNSTGTMNFGSGAAIAGKLYQRVKWPTLGGDLKGFEFMWVSADPPPA